jgi:hypothetical protein
MDKGKKINEFSKSELIEQKELYEAEIKHYNEKGALELVKECEGYLKEVCDELDKR